MTTQLDQAWELAKQRYASSTVYLYRCTAGRVMTSRGLKIQKAI